MSIFSGENLFSVLCAGAEAAVVQQWQLLRYCVTVKKDCRGGNKDRLGDLLLWVLHKQNAFALAAAAKASLWLLLVAEPPPVLSH